MSFSKTLDILLYIFLSALMLPEQEFSRDTAHRPVDEFALYGEYGKIPLLLNRLGICCH